MAGWFPEPSNCFRFFIFYLHYTKSKVTEMTRKILTAILWASLVGGPASGQLRENFDDVFGMGPGDSGPTVGTWEGALRSDVFGPTGIFPGIDEACGFFDAHEGPSYSYLAMNYRNVNRFGPSDTTSTWLISPVIPLQDRTMISFYTRTIEGSIFPDRLILRLSTNGSSVDVGEGANGVGDFQTLLLDINPNYEMGGYSEEWTLYELELKGFGGGPGRLAFHYFNQSMNTNGHYIGIDTFASIPFLLGDVNCDGAIDLLDVQPLVALLTTGGYSEKADMNSDGAVDLEDIELFVDTLVGG
jgi:hypothetical protein